MPEAIQPRKARNFVILEVALRCLILATLWVASAALLGAGFTAFRGRFAALLLVVILTPDLAFAWFQFLKTSRAEAMLRELRERHADELLRSLESFTAMKTDMGNATPYLELIEEQMADSLAHSDQEVLAAIEELGALSEKANDQKQRISQSMESGKDIAEGTRRRVEENHQLITAVERQLKGQISTITSIALHTRLLALNAEIEAAWAGDSGNTFSVVAHELRRLAERLEQAANDISGGLTALSSVAGVEGEEAQRSPECGDATDLMAQLGGDLVGLQGEFGKSSALLLNVMSEVDANYSKTVDQLTGALGHLQFQDLVRQRMESVRTALAAMRGHLSRLSEGGGSATPNENPGTSFTELLASHIDRSRSTNRMEPETSEGGGGLAIELF